jgi:hypothetical protein
MEIMMNSKMALHTREIRNGVSALRILKNKGLLCSLLLLAAAGVGHAQAPAAVASPQPLTAEVLKAYHSTMSAKELPGKGCFTATYPSTVWQQTECGVAPNHPYRNTNGKVPETVGNGYDYAAQVTSGVISSAVGSFKSVTGLTSESDQATDNRFSLQLNTATFETSVCQSAVNPDSCLGWQQFIFSNGGVAFIQYWLLNYGVCPQGWNTYYSDCWRNGSSQVSVPVQSITNLAKLSLTGKASSGGKDTIYMTTASGTVHAANNDSILYLATQWTGAEFNLFGDCCSTGAFVNGKATIEVELNVNNGTTQAPECIANDGTTGETNNLTFSGSCTTVGGSAPAIEFTERTAPISIWSYTGPACSGSYCPGWQELDDNGDSVRLAGGGGYLYQLHNTGKIWLYENRPCSGTYCPGWALLDNNVNTAQIAAAGPDLYQLQNNGKVEFYTGTSWTELDNNSSIVTIAAAGPNLFELRNEGQIYHYVGSGWQELDDNPAAVAIAAGGNDLYQLHNDGSIWHYTGTPCNGSACYGWQMLDDNPAALAIVADSNDLYQFHNDGSIWRYTGTPCNGNACYGWQKLDDNPAAVDIAASDGNLYQLHSDGSVWLFTGTACSGNYCPGWQTLDDNPATGSITSADGALYQMHIPHVARSLILTCYECRW